MPVYFKTIFFFLILFSLCSGADRRTDTARLKIAVYNTKFLFDGKPPEGRASFQWKNNPEKAEEHMKAVAEAIRKLDADILGLIEVEDLAVLRHMNRKYLKRMNYKAYLVQGKDSFTGQDVGLLTRIDPLGRLNRTNLRLIYRKDKTRGVSKNCYADFLINGQKFRLICAHLISKRWQNNAFRDLQADILRQVAQDVNHHVVILGDFNAFDGDVPDRNQNYPECGVLDILKDLNPDRPGNELLSVARTIPPPRRYSCWYDRNRDVVIDSTELSMLDHILISRELSKNVRKSGVLSKDYDPRKISDHYPVWVELGF